MQNFVKGSLEVKLPTISTDEIRDGKSQRREEKRREEERRKKIKKRESLRRKKIQVREKVGKSRNTAFFNDLWLRRVEK